MITLLLGGLVLLGGIINLFRYLKERRNRVPWQPVRRKAIEGKPKDAWDEVLEIVNGKNGM